MVEKFKIQGGETLRGEVSIGGAKNSVLKLLAASLLVKGTTKIYNVPELTDVKIMLKVLAELGAKLNYNKEEKSVEVSSNYLLDMVITLMMVSQTMLMYKFKLVTPENALKQIDMLMDRWVKHS